MCEMNQGRFDELAKGLATGTLSRGKAIRWMGGALLGAALTSVPGVAWANDCRRLGRECRRDSQCCSRNCIRRGDDKVCGCPTGQTRCNDRCVNLKRNERHCGTCFNRCAEGDECVDGMCQGGGCPSGTTLCGTECCQTGATCVNGTCCRNAQVCGTGTTLTCCAEGKECVNGVCGEPTCKPLGGSCIFDRECCSSICASNGTCVSCRDLFGNCTSDTQCCSGLACANGTCGCPPDRVLGPNGSCVKFCTPGGADCPPGCTCFQHQGSNPAFPGICGTTALNVRCTTNDDCGRGSFCVGNDPNRNNVCVGVC